MNEKLEIIEYIKKYPSGDNCQPFSFKFQANELHIYHDNLAAEHVFNSLNFSSHIGLGCLFSYIESYSKLSGEGLKCEVDIDAKSSLFGRVIFQDFKNKKVESDNIFESRKTDRRIYNNYQLSAPDKEEVEALECSEYDGVRNRFLHGPFDKDLIQMFMDTDALLWDFPDACYDVLKCVNLTEEEKTRQYGMPWKSLGVNAFDAWGMKNMRKNFKYMYPILRHPLKAKGKSLVKKQFNSSSFLYLATAKGVDPMSAVELGKEATKTWAKLCSMGYSVQPMSISTITGVIYNHLKTPSNFPRAQKDLFAYAEKLLCRKFCLEPNEIPIWLFRVGKTNGELPSSMEAPTYSDDAILSFA